MGCEVSTLQKKLGRESQFLRYLPNSKPFHDNDTSKFRQPSTWL